MRRRSNVRSTIEQYARQHRCALNGPEQMLWAEIRGGRLGVWFRRQVVIGRYIVDFLAPRWRLVVEVDGATIQPAWARTRAGIASSVGWAIACCVDAELIHRNVHAAVEQIRTAALSAIVEPCAWTRRRERGPGTVPYSRPSAAALRQVIGANESKCWLREFGSSEVLR